MQTPSIHSDGSIGIFDSGVGGLTVFQRIRELMPGEDLLYYADQAHVPYGPRSDREVQDFSLEICRFLRRQGAKIIVVACNTASAAALDHLREYQPDIAIVGMEPAIKPGVGETKNGRVGVLATMGTFDSRRYASLMTRFASEISVFEDSCPGLVEQIEAGHLDEARTKAILSDALKPMLAQDIDTLILGCTHYPFLLPLIEELAGPGVSVIDPAPAVARQTQRVLADRSLLNARSSGGTLLGFTSGSPSHLSSSIERLLGISFTVEQAVWYSGRLLTP